MRRIGRAAKRIGRAGIGVVLAVGLYLGLMQLSGNVHEVIPGELYRSGQLSGARIEQLSRTYGIRTVLNLRGRNPQMRWYRDETEAAARLGITHIDFPMSSREVLDIDRIHEVIALMRTSPKPILIHCMGGADRSGLASALYLGFVAERTEGEAGRQLSLYFGHFAVPVLSKAYAMDITWDNLLIDKMAMATPAQSSVLSVSR
ncbi:protein tyrosine/serine phosphatase [Hoeflea marina]|uniref:Protein tyrosine/serine phosphatase n=1 Tax=Hoeflea marina TaxID=274592 RepID=A0A317PQ34_9HYPH|nr:tyrosine-protein phosphatase [Hoeflea marina]PWW02269.1 protein tyrosine/serine phosphatase [Hoeflea marina]